MSEGLQDPIEGLFNITPSDTVELTKVTRAIILGSSGNLKVTTANGDIVTLVNVAAGVFHPLRVRQVWQTGTGASGIRGGY